MKITSHGNRIIRFDNSNKIVNIDVKKVHLMVKCRMYNKIVQKYYYKITLY